MSLELNKMMMDDYFRQLGKLYRKMHGKEMPAEIILIGGASCIINYGFREVTTDIDALILASGAIKDAIKQVGRSNGLNDNWLNDDFRFTDSFSDKIRQFSTYYKEFSNCLTIRTVKAEYLIAMKLVSSRYYKNDMSDIVGILREQMEIGDPLTKERIDKAVKDLYGNWNKIDEFESTELSDLLDLDYDSLSDVYEMFKKNESHNAGIIKQLDEEYDLSNDFDPNTYLKDHDGNTDWQEDIKIAKRRK